jgi:hypothetical protein
MAATPYGECIHSETSWKYGRTKALEDTDVILSGQVADTEIETLYRLTNQHPLEAVPYAGQ